ncbi:MAG: stage V sporulation protein AC [Lachnospiraceae bacterium]|nr:stage V sporulation protein AC [Lachnospiraceae bacterium]
MEKEPSKQAYQEYVEQVTPKYNRPRNCIRAFLVGGAICTFGEVIKHVMMGPFGMKEEGASSVVTLVLILLSVLATGFHLYPTLANFSGAGSLVPITGFANSVASPAIEYKKEGHVFGIGVKIFTIAGPVILYGVFSSWVLGLIYWGGTCFGWW